MFLEKGFNGYCHDISPESRNYLNINLKSFGDRIQVIDDYSLLSVATFDYLFAFEVLEHIKDDLIALTEWSKFLKPKGKVIVSVPAHQKKFSKSDQYVGHIRRYEKQELSNLLKDAGYQHIEIVNYGFPLTLISRFIANIIIAKDNSIDDISIEERNLKSSYSRPYIISKYLSFINQELYIPFSYIHRWFYHMDLGDGLVAVAEKI